MILDHRNSVAPQRCLAIFAFAVVALTAPPAYAALGDDASAVADDQARMQASVKFSRGPRFAVHELAVPTGATLREFVGGDGTVFSIAWSGGWRPNLRDIMGVHYDRYIAATRGRRVARGPVRIELPGLLIVMGGRQRSFFGQVYLTDALPAGLTADDIH
jgi:hypothetical protein